MLLNHRLNIAASPEDACNERAAKIRSETAAEAAVYEQSPFTAAMAEDIRQDGETAANWWDLQAKLAANLQRMYG